MTSHAESRTGMSNATKPMGKNLAIQKPRTNTEKAIRWVAGVAMVNIPLAFYDSTTGRFVAIVLLAVLLATLRVHYKESAERKNT